MDVKVLHLPTDTPELERCRALGIPRLILVESPAPPPVCVDVLEDWVRMPADRDDVSARKAALRFRATSGVPVLEPGGVLHFGGRSLPLAPADAALLAPLLASYQSSVRRDVLLDLLWPGPGHPRRNALDLRILRLRRRIAPVGLVVRTVWGTGYLLDSGPAAAIAEAS